jgi:transcriptional regulator with GAF, ATPase, and Fis domain
LKTVTDPQRLSQVLIELADTLVDDFDVVDFMSTLAARCVELLGAHEAGVMLADQQGALKAVASSSERARVLELYELQNEEGPCLDCYRSGDAVVNQPLDVSEARWPRFAPEARRLGFSAVHALPMRLRGEVIGAINIFNIANGDLSPIDVEVGQALADVATIGLLQHRSVREARVLSEQLQVALTSRIILEQAKGVLSERANLDMPTAFGTLRTYARARGLPLSEVAAAVVDGTLTHEALLRP